MDHISTLYFLAGIFGAVLILLILSKNSSKNIIPFVLLILAASYYSITYGIELMLQDPDLILAAIRFEYLGIAVVPALWLIFIISYIRREKLLKPLIYVVLFVIPAIVIIVSQSPFFVPLLYQSTEFIRSGDLMLIAMKPGPIYMLNAFYLFIAFISGILMLVDFSKHTRGIVSRQVNILILSGIVLLVVYTIQSFWFGPRYHIDMTPLAYLFTLLMSFVGLFHYRLFSLVPVAYDSVFMRVPTGLIITDNLGYAIEANDAAEEALGSDIKSNSGKIITEYSPDWEEFNDFIKDALDGSPKEREGEISHTKEGRSIIYHIQTTFLKDRHGNIEGLIVTMRDVTLQKNAEKEIKESELRFRELFDQSPVAYVTLDEEGTVTGINPEFTHMTGFSREEIINSRLIDLVPESRREDVLNHYYKFLDSGEIYLELEIITKSGGELTVFLSARIQFDAVGNYVRTHCVLHDITDRKRTEQALSQANKKLNLLSSITRHDILNQITVLKGYLDLEGEYLSSSDNPDPTLKKYNEKESGATENIYQQIKFTEDYQDIGVRTPAWQNVSDTFRNSVQGIVPADIPVIIDADEKLEIYADPLLEKVFYNLVENSLNYGDKLTKIRLFTEMHDNGLILKYADDGVGVPAEEKENIFLRKYYSHSGLGMFLSREILAITGIKIKETGIPGDGALFEISVPNGMYRL